MPNKPHNGRAIALRLLANDPSMLCAPPRALIVFCSAMSLSIKLLPGIGRKSTGFPRSNWWGPDRVRLMRSPDCSTYVLPSLAVPTYKPGSCPTSLSRRVHFPVLVSPLLEQLLGLSRLNRRANCLAYRLRPLPSIGNSYVGISYEPNAFRRGSPGHKKDNRAHQGETT